MFQSTVLKQGVTQKAGDTWTGTGDLATKKVFDKDSLGLLLGVELSLADFEELARVTPLLANIRPSGKYLMEDFFYAGGLPAVMKEILPLLHGGAPRLEQCCKEGRGEPDHRVAKKTMVATAITAISAPYPSAPSVSATSTTDALCLSISAMTSSDAFYAHVREELAGIEAAGLFKRERVIATPQASLEAAAELAVREAIHGRPVKNLDALANPDAVGHFAGLFPPARERRRG